MPAKLYNVSLTDEQTQYLSDITGIGKHSARKISRARILLSASSGKGDDEIVSDIHTGSSAVQRVRERSVKNGLTAAPEEKARPGQPEKPSGADEALLTAPACSEAPAGRSRRTLRLSADRLAESEIVPSVSYVTIHNILKKTT